MHSGDFSHTNDGVRQVGAPERLEGGRGSEDRVVSVACWDELFTYVL